MNERIFNEFAPEVMAALIAKAKKGDVAAMRLFFELRSATKAGPEELPILQVVEIPNDEK